MLPWRLFILLVWLAFLAIPAPTHVSSFLGPQASPLTYNLHLDAVTPKTFAHDANGNRATETGGLTHEWDARNQLVAVVKGTHRSEFVYDGFGRRVAIIEKENGTITSHQKFVWCGLQLCEERDSTGSTVTKRFFGSGVQVGTDNYYYTFDHLGSIREVLNNEGENSDDSDIMARYDYDPYGKRTKVGGQTGFEADFGFTGHYYHAPSGLYLAPYRAYDPATGRWLSRDPIGEAGGLNLYGYVGNDPINKIDPLGLSPADVENIVDVSHQTMNQMNRDGHRNSIFPPASSANSDVSGHWWNPFYWTPWYDGKGWECVRQSECVCKKLNSQPQRDDQWTIKTVTSPNLTHTWVEATSMNPSDPIIKIDPWWGYTTVTPNVISSTPGPTPISNVNVNNIPSVPIPGYFPR